MPVSEARAAAARWYRVRRPAITRGFLIALAGAIAFLWLIQPVTLAQRLIRTEALPHDNNYAGRMIATDAVAGAPDVIVIGGSSMRDIIPLDAGARLSALCRRDFTIFNAATSSQHPADSRAILDALRRPPRLIVIGLSYRRLSRSPWNDPWRLEQRHVALPRSGDDFAAALIRGQLDAGLFDSLAQLRRMSWEWALFTSALGGRALPSHPGARHDADLLPDRVASHRDKQQLIDTAWIADRGNLERSADEMAKYWIDFARDMHKRGSRTLFVMTPYGREADAMGRAYARPVDRALASIARAAPLIDLRGVPLSDSDFRDPLHVTHAGRDRMWPGLSAALASHGGCAPPGTR